MNPWAGRRVLVLGCGYAGRAILDRAAVGGAVTCGLTRNPETAAGLSGGGHAAVVADLGEPDWSRGLPPGSWDVVVCSVSGGGYDTRAYRQTYVETQQRVSEWASRALPGHYLYTGSTGVYPQDDGSWVDETSMVGSSPRADLLLEAEAVALAVPVKSVVTVLRLAGIYGPGRRGTLDRLREGADEVQGRAEAHVNLIHRDDVAGAVESALRAGLAASGVFNVSDGHPPRRGDMVAWLCRRLGRPVPAFAGSGARGGADRRISPERAERVLGWRPQVPDFRAGYDAILAGAS